MGIARRSILRSVAGFVGGALSSYGGSRSGADPTDERLWTNLSSGNSLAGINVTPETARAVAAYHACKNNIGQDLGKLPIKLFRRIDDDTREEVRDDIRFDLLHRKPNNNMTPIVFKQLLTDWKLDPGNGYAEIQFNGMGQPAALRPIDPNRVMPRINRATDELEYVVTFQHGGQKVLPQDRILHIRGFGSDIQGASIARTGAQSLGLSVAQQEMAASIFGNGTLLGLIFTHPGAMGTEARDNWMRSIREAFGGVKKAFKPFVIEEGMTVEQIDHKMKEAQLLQSRQFQVAEIARWFRMPPHKIQDLERATFSNIEEQNQEYVDDTLMPHIVAWEEELNRKLLPNDEDMFFEFQVDALLRGNSKARGEFYTALFNIGVMSRNDIRSKENLNGVPGGDVYYVQGNLAAVGEDGTARLVAGTDANTTTQERVQAIHNMISASADRLVTREYNVAKKVVTATPGTLKARLEDFYARQRDIMYENLLPLMQCALVECGGDVRASRQRTRDVVDQLVEESMDRLCLAQGKANFLEFLESYREHRPGQIADAVIRCAGATLILDHKETAPADGEKRKAVSEDGTHVYKFSAKSGEWEYVETVES